jgi:hypothetical protein
MSYGKITVGYGTREQRELEVIDYLRASFLDNRLISISTIEDGSIVAVVENPPSTCRASQSSIWLSKESFIGIIGAAFLYFSAKNEDLGKLLKDVTINNDIQYSFSENLKNPTTEKISNENENEEDINVSVNSFIERFKGAYPDVEGRTNWKNWKDIEKDMELHLLSLMAKPKIYAITAKEGYNEFFYSKEKAENKIETEYKKDFPDEEFWVEKVSVK